MTIQLVRLKSEEALRAKSLRHNICCTDHYQISQLNYKNRKRNKKPFVTSNNETSINPYKILTEIWPILARSRRVFGRRDLGKILARSQRDLSHLGEILVISPRSRLSRRVLVNLAEISVISARSRKNLGEILVISPRSRLSRRDLGNLGEISAKILYGIYLTFRFVLEQ